MRTTPSPAAPPKGARQPTTAMLVDAHEVMRIGMLHLLRGHAIDVVADCGSWSDALRLARRHQPDLVLMDSMLPDATAADACGAIRIACPRAWVIILTAHDCARTRASCLGAGAHGYLLKDAGAAELAAAIHGLMRPRAPAPHRADTPASPALSLLSPQEKKIAPLVADGKTNKEIAGILGLSDKTVKNYLSNMYLKLQVRRRAQLAAMVARMPPRGPPGQG